jgi:hypothetical protein
MSHFYGVLQGSRGQATRCGTKNSGVETTAASWDGAIQVDLRYDEESDKNIYTVSQIPWHGQGVRKIIAEGIVGSVEEI